MEKESYETLVVEVIEFDDDDVITTSDGNPTETPPVNPF